jgi:uncharacterized protein (TIGR03435 family)
MMQGLLIERLQLKVRHEHQVVPIYALLIGKRGPKFKPSREPIDPAKQGMSRSSTGPGLVKLAAVGQTIPNSCPHCSSKPPDHGHDRTNRQIRFHHYLHVPALE